MDLIEAQFACVIIQNSHLIWMMRVTEKISPDWCMCLRTNGWSIPFYDWFAVIHGVETIHIYLRNSMKRDRETRSIGMRSTKRDLCHNPQQAIKCPAWKTDYNGRPLRGSIEAVIAFICPTGTLLEHIYRDMLWHNGKYPSSLSYTWTMFSNIINIYFQWENSTKF